jgi:sulfur transfer complex TusBCD TusB component (DsrH family)
VPSDLQAKAVNERLFARGLLEQFDEAVRRGDTAQMIELLAAVDLGDQAAWISETILKHPNRYGRISN